MYFLRTGIHDETDLCDVGLQGSEQELPLINTNRFIVKNSFQACNAPTHIQANTLHLESPEIFL